MEYAILFLPLLGSIIGYLGKSVTKYFSEIITSFLVSISAVLSIIVFWNGFHNDIYGNYKIFEWISSGDFTANWSINIDPLSSIMLVVVTLISALVHVYSIGYMSHDPFKPRFMSYLSLFTFAMLVLVVSDNFIQLFFGWEGVGLCSYLLIGFWYKKETANNAAIKAFIVNRIGDFGLAIAIFLIFFFFGTINFDEAFQATKEYTEKKIEKAIKEKVEKISKLESDLKLLAANHEIVLNNSLETKDKVIAKLNKDNDQIKADKKIAELELKQKYTLENTLLKDEIERLKNHQPSLTKEIGEDFEQYFVDQFNSLKQVAYPNATFEKDNIVIDGTKGDFILKYCDEEGDHVTSIMFEMRFEKEGTKSKRKYNFQTASNLFGYTSEVNTYVKKLRTIMRYLGTCDGNMQEGSLRADVNVSVSYTHLTLPTKRIV